MASSGTQSFLPPFPRTDSPKDRHVLPKSLPSLKGKYADPKTSWWTVVISEIWLCHISVTNYTNIYKRGPEPVWGMK